MGCWVLWVVYVQLQHHCAPGANMTPRVLLLGLGQAVTLNLAFSFIALPLGRYPQAFPPHITAQVFEQLLAQVGKTARPSGLYAYIAHGTVIIAYVLRSRVLRLLGSKPDYLAHPSPPLHWHTSRERAQQRKMCRGNCIHVFALLLQRRTQRCALLRCGGRGRS